MAAAIVDHRQPVAVAVESHAHRRADARVPRAASAVRCLGTAQSGWRSRNSGIESIVQGVRRGRPARANTREATPDWQPPPAIHGDREAGEPARPSTARCARRGSSRARRRSRAARPRLATTRAARSRAPRTSSGVGRQRPVHQLESIPVRRAVRRGDDGDRLRRRATAAPSTARASAVARTPRTRRRPRRGDPSTSAARSVGRRARPSPPTTTVAGLNPGEAAAGDRGAEVAPGLLEERRVDRVGPRPADVAFLDGGVFTHRWLPGTLRAAQAARNAWYCSSQRLRSDGSGRQRGRRRSVARSPPSRRRARRSSPRPARCRNRIRGARRGTPGDRGSRREAAATARVRAPTPVVQTVPSAGAPSAAATS